MPDDPYFTPEEARAQEPALASEEAYPDELIDAMREAVEQALEHACGVAFVTRTATDERHDGPGSSDLLLDWPRVQDVSAASVGGSSITGDALTGLVPYRDGRVYYSGGWVSGRGNVLITYTHGYEAVPGRVKRAAIILTKRFLVQSPVNDRATQLVNSDGTTQWLVTAGVRDAIFDIPEANAVVEEYSVRGSVG